MYNFIPQFYNTNPHNFNNIKKNHAPQNTSIEFQHQNKENKHKKHTEEQLENSEKNKDEFLFEIFGIKIFFDDVLIICILLFLYEEKIEDHLLYIALILLLLS